ncbi:MAG: hypothetical protein WAL47_17990 [Pyrinomonadaceae bacterium]
MEAKTAKSAISREKMTAFVTGLLGDYPNPEGDPQPPSPWDPIIRQTFEKVFGPHPEPWRTRFESAGHRLRNLGQTRPEVYDIIGDRLNRVALNPQPLPPRWAFGVEFLRLAADRLVAIQETADVINNGSEQGIIVVGGRVSELVDFVCGNNFPKRFPPIPPPGPDPDPRLRGDELVLMGAELTRYSKTIANKVLGRELTAAGEKLIDAGLERL